MVTPAKRMEKWIRELADLWSAPLRGWMGSWLSWGLNLILDVLGQKAAPLFTPLIEKLERETEIPPELKLFFDELKSPQGEFAAVLAHSAGGALVGGAIGKIIDYVLRGLIRGLSYMPGFFIHDPTILVSLWRRDVISEDYLNNHLHFHGLGDDDIEQLKKVTEFMPGPGELVNWQAKEVFEPEMIERYGLDSEFAGLRHEDFRKVGVNEEQERNFWRAHWQHASWMQVVEMLHRGLLTESEVSDWFRLVEIPPFWRTKLIKTAYTWPTRVDVRRWWDMRTISEERLIELYKGMGYRGDNLDDYVRWTKVYVDFGMMMTRFRNGWITEQDIRDWLKKLEIPEERIQQFMEEKTKPEKGARVAGERELTATDAVLGVKKGVISWAEGIELLMDLGYDEEEANFKLAVRIETEGGSPENMAEYKRLTQLWRVSQGLPTKMTPAEIKAAEKQLTEKYPLKVPLTEEELKVKVDTIRRKRRSRQLTRDEEIAGLLELGLTVKLATAYADNDDLRLRAEKEGK